MIAYLVVFLCAAATTFVVTPMIRRLVVRTGGIVQPGGRDSSTVWLDLEEKDPARRFKMFRVIGAGEDPVTKWNNWQMAIHFSADGSHWGEPVAKTGR